MTGKAEVIDKYLAMLPERTELAIRLRYGLEGKGLILDDLGDRFGICRERIRQVLLEGLAKMREQGWEELIDALHQQGPVRQWGKVVDAVSSDITSQPSRMCPRCLCAEPLAEFKNGRLCTICHLDSHRKHCNTKYICAVPGYGWQAWWKLYPDAPNADAGRAAYFASKRQVTQNGEDLDSP